MEDDARVGTLTVPGARLHYELRGKGPLLLVIPGGPQDAGVFAGVARRLATDYTVLTYDPRGNSRSSTKDGSRDLDVDEQADDAARLIDAAGGPAFVFGTSGGAQIALALAARHPDHVRAVLAHEPPTIMALDDPAPALAEERELYETYKSDGVEAAMAKFFGDNGLDGEEGDASPPDMPPPSEADMETFARVSGNFEYWLAHGMIPLATYVPDYAVLAGGTPRIAVAIGEGSTGQPIEAMGRALADRLGVTPMTFPGDHMGFETHEADFATLLHRTFSA